MKKLLCYLGILGLVFLLFLPPALRIFMNDQDEKDEEIIKSAILMCQNNGYVTSTYYENNKINMIILRKVLLSSEESETKNEVESISDLDNLLDTLKDQSTLTYKELENAKVLQIDFSIYDHKDLDLHLINNPIEAQKAYYESQGLICNIQE